MSADTRIAKAWHATRHLADLLADGLVKPARLPFVYLFTDPDDAREYAAQFGYEAVVSVELPRESIVSRWSPSYAPRGKVLKVAGVARVLGVAS